MVQKKVPSKLGIQADHVKSDKHLANLKPNPSQYHDGKTKTAEMKKKLKKSRSFKLSDLEGYRSSPPSSSSFGRNNSQPGKPPPLHVTTSPAKSPQKQQPLIRAEDGSPNYMKSTSSSNAKKELSPVSVRNTQTGSERNNRWKNKLSNPTVASVSGTAKSAKTITRSSSLKKVRTLTKTPSFKLTRAPKIKTSTVAMSEDINLQKATCSSTLKDSKFPEYLVLNPGGTEYEGTSVVKVCPYNCCSLNGHHHTPLPPLKSFLSARRHALKSLKSFKLECRSPRRVKLSKDTKKASDIQQSFFDGSPVHDEIDVGCSDISSSSQDHKMDFFIQIYAKDHEDGIGQSDPAGGLKDQHGIKSRDGKQIVAADGEEDILQVAASVSDGSPNSEIDFEEDFAQHQAEAETEAKRRLFEDPKEQWTEEDLISPLSLSQEETRGGDCCDNTSNVEDSESIMGDGSQATDMEWEGGDFSVMEFNDEGKIPIPDREGLDSKSKCLSEIYDTDSHDERTLWTDGIIMASEAVQEASLEENAALERQFDGKDFGPEGLSSKMQIPVVYESPKSFTFDQLSVSEYSYHCLSDSEETSEEVMTFAPINVTSSDLTEETIQEFREENDDSTKDEVLVPGTLVGHVDGMESERTQGQDEALNAEQDPEELGANGAVVNDSISSSSQALHESGQVKSDELYRNDIIESPEDSEGAVSDISVEAEELQMDTGNHVESDASESAVEVSIRAADKRTSSTDKTNSSQDLSEVFCGWKVRRGKRPAADDEELWKFNPREPNYLPVIPDPEAEKVDLKHQLMDEKRNAEEWMIDYALQQAVTKLAPARKRKVALLVEAFEAVIPIPKYESHIQNTSAFTHHRPMQACN